ncbi:unnamed protein product [Linum tenue]|uniref:Bifunctional inhibitor/plant lipid transfer protein/seed storage helical domain-containing protein n=1 Tax=Linum tenue TaxID=586396 RepID=A0AAV0L8A1_9ROSI|nr:unnamed protein product [Linum tenue]
MGSAKAVLLLLHLLLLATLFLSSVSSPCSPPPLQTPPAAGSSKCPEDALKFGVCGSWLGLVSEVVGTKPSKDCCTLIQGVADLEAALCLCSAMKANVLGLVKLEIPIAVTLLVNACGGNIPQGFKCT